MMSMRMNNVRARAYPEGMRTLLSLTLMMLLSSCPEPNALDDAGLDARAPSSDTRAPQDDTAAGDTGPLQDAPAASGCAPEALELIRLVNDYRATNALPAIAASPSLCRVASAHTRDLSAHPPEGSCNLHSWSDQGSWSACCYTSDHAQAQCMWDKPRQLTDYPGNGYENAFMGSNDPGAALSAWMRSSGHNEVILNRGIWADHPWNALGADIHDGYAVLWFGEENDPASR
jgi:Cysteine-rich secretory protein family